MFTIPQLCLAIYLMVTAALAVRPFSRGTKKQKHQLFYYYVVVFTWPLWLAVIACFGLVMVVVTTVKQMQDRLLQRIEDYIDAKEEAEEDLFMVGAEAAITENELGCTCGGRGAFGHHTLICPASVVDHRRRLLQIVPGMDIGFFGRKIYRTEDGSSYSWSDKKGKSLGDACNADEMAQRMLKHAIALDERVKQSIVHNFDEHTSL